MYRDILDIAVQGIMAINGSASLSYFQCIIYSNFLHVEGSSWILGICG